MARLPDVTELGTPSVPVPDRPMVSYTGGIADAAKASIGDATAKLGATVEKVGSDVQDTQDRLSYASGVQNFLAKNLDIRQRAFNDPDYTTAPQRYGAELRQSVTDAGSAIRSPVLRAEFTGAMSRYVNGTQDEILSHATAKAKDAKVGWLDSFTNGTIENGLQTPDPALRGEAINSITMAINALRDDGTLSAADAEQRRHNAIKTYTDKYYTMRAQADPAGTLKELAPSSMAPDGTPIFANNGTLADHMDPSDRMAHIYKLKPVALDLQAQRDASTYLGRDKPQTPAMPVGIDQMTGAIKGQESGGAANPPTSVNGAVGQFQITPATFAQYAKPGERIDNPADNAAVGQRIITDLWDRTDGDPARMAVGYFSGPGNIAPPGYETPWLKDTVDGNGKSVSSYVGDVMHRLGRGDVLHDKATILARIDRDYAGNPELGRKVKAEVTQSFAIANTEALAQAAQKKDAEEAASDKYGKVILSGQPLTPQVVGTLRQQILADPALGFTRRDRLITLMEEKAKGDAAGDTKHYGPGFWDLYRRVHAADGDPNKITDPSQLYSLAGPQPTPAPNFPLTGAPGMTKPGNLDPWNRPVLHNPDGSYSTTSSMSISTEDGEVLIPTVVDGKRLTPEQAADHYKQTGENLGTFDTPDHADAYATALHNAQATMYDNQGNRLTQPGPLTMAGVDKLVSEIAGKRTPEGEAKSRMVAGALAYAKHNLSFEQDFGYFKIPDPKGQDAFNVGFLPAFFDAFDKGTAAGKTPYQLLSKDSPDFIVDKLISTFKRTPAQELKDRTEAGLVNPQGQPAKPDLSTEAGVSAALGANLITREDAYNALVRLGKIRPGTAAASAPPPASGGPAVPIMTPGAH